MNYNPEFHENNRKRWNDEDLKYLMEWYDIIGPEEMSFALGRTVGTIVNKVFALREKGLMEKPSTRIIHKTIKKELPKQPNKFN